MNKITIEKYYIICLLVSINLLLSTTFIIYSHYWYIYLVILASQSIINSFSVICLLLKRILFGYIDPEINRIEPKNYIYIVPCYNESEEELTNSINSIVLQRTVENDKRMLFIICDGKATGTNNSISTDMILKKILNINQLGEYYIYKTWDTDNSLKMYHGKYSYSNISIPYILFIKEHNYGKRDSLVLARRLCYRYNICRTDEDDLTSDMYDIFSKNYKTQIDYIIGIDADTIFEYNTSYRLIGSIYNRMDVYGCVGYIDINNFNYNYNYFNLYQYGEYTFAQCLKRNAQSSITGKVSCLSGCNQILRISEETCGDKILNIFNYKPTENDNIFTHILSYASEDRNHVCHMLSIYPYVKTIQNLNAIAYTNVPTSISVFLSQRRRWNLGANCNDMMLVYLPGINIFERIAAFVNVMNFCLTPFIFIATIFFIMAIVKHSSMLMLYLSIILFIPISYSYIIPIIIKPQGLLYYYISYLVFYIFSSIVNLATYTYSIIYMDTIKWGKTREIIDNNIEVDDNYIEVEDNDEMINTNYLDIETKLSTYYPQLINNIHMNNIKITDV